MCRMVDVLQFLSSFFLVYFHKVIFYKFYLSILEEICVIDDAPRELTKAFFKEQISWSNPPHMNTFYHLERKSVHLPILACT
jgi:hypothetical protein